MTKRYMRRIFCALVCVSSIAACSTSQLSDTSGAQAGTEAVAQATTCACKRKNPKADCGCDTCKASDMKKCGCGSAKGGHDHGGHCSHQ